MANFVYVARTDTGTLQRGNLQAETPASLKSQLSSRGLRLVSMQEETKPFSMGEFAGRYLNPWQYISPRSVDVEILLSQLAVMLRSGVTLLSSLKVAEEQARYLPMKTLVRRFSESVQDGNAISDSMLSSKSFPQLAVQLTRIGELTGTLDLAFEESSRQMSRRRQNRSATITALAYPVFVLFAAFAVSAYMVLYVIPQIEKALSALGRPLPKMTQTLVDFSRWIQINGPTTAVILVGIVLAFILLYLWPPSRMQIDRWSLRLPLIGNVLRLGGTVTFASSMVAMIRSGITVVEGLRISEKLYNNKYLAQCITSAREAVIAGNGLGPALSQPHTFAPMLGSMVSVAENSGQMELVLEQVMQFHQEQLQSAIKRLSALLEPLIVVVVGGIVGYVYISFFLALLASGGAG